MPQIAAPTMLLLLRHPWSGLLTRVPIRAESLTAAAVIAQALRERLRRHEEN